MGSSSIGNFSCNGPDACYNAGREGSSGIGNSSCNGPEACYEAGREGSGIIADCESNVESVACPQPSLVGGGLGPVIAAGAQQARENREARAVAAVQQQPAVISPPNTGDAGLAAD